MILIRRPHIQQPRNGPEIDWSNPITRGLFEGFVSTSDVSLANGALTFSAARSLYFATGLSKNGLYYGKGTTNTATKIQFRPVNFTAATSSSHLVVFTPQSAPTTRTTVVAAHTYSFPVAVGSGSDAAIVLAYRMAGDNLTTYITSDTVVRVGDSYRVVAVHNNGVGFSLFINGRLAGKYADARPLAAVAQGSQYYSWAGPGLGASYKRALSDTEALALSENPWQIFKPRRIFIPVAATGGATYTLSAATYAPGSITATGVTPRVSVAVA